MDSLDSVNLDEFEREWVGLAEEVVNQIFANPVIQKIKTEVRTKGGIDWDHKSQFIVIANKIKSDLIEQRYGQPGTDSYKEFTKRWEIWQRERGRNRAKPTNLFEENISHFLYGSTPDPELFLRDFDMNKDVK